MHLNLEVLRYSSSASTIRPLFEYLFITISGYTVYVTIRGDESNNRLYDKLLYVIPAVIRTSQQTSLFTSHDDGQLQLQIKVSSLSKFLNELVPCINPSGLIDIAVIALIVFSY